MDQDIPHGHGMSFKRGYADGLLDETAHENAVHETHLATYRRGLEEGREMRDVIARRVRD